MRNLEQMLAKKLLTDYKVCLDILENHRQSHAEKSFLNGELSVLMDTAHSIWGSDDLNLRSHFWFLETLKEIASAEPAPNVVELNRFEAFALFKHFSDKKEKAKQDGFEGLAESYFEKAEKWLKIAEQIEQSNADDVNKNLVNI